MLNTQKRRQFQIYPSAETLLDWNARSCCCMHNAPIIDRQTATVFPELASLLVYVASINKKHHPEKGFLVGCHQTFASIVSMFVKDLKKVTEISKTGNHQQQRSNGTRVIRFPDECTNENLTLTPDDPE